MCSKAFGERVLAGLPAGVFAFLGLAGFCQGALSQGAIGQTDDPASWTLVRAIHEGNIAAVDRLLWAGANVNARDRQTGRTPLVEAVAAGNEAICILLIGQKADVNATGAIDRPRYASIQSDPPLHLAVRTRRLDIANDLLGAGADVNLRSTTGETPLDVALMIGESSIITLLLKHGADPRPSLSQAITAGKAEFAADILRRARDLKITGLDPAGGMLTTAIALKERLVCSLLVELGSDPNQRVALGVLRNMEARLRDRPRNVLVRPYEYTSQFSLACGIADRETVAMLLDHKADATVKTRDGRSLVSVASGNPDSGVLDLLFERGLVGQSPSAEESAPLRIAAAAGLVNNCRTLLKHGANANAASSEGLTALVAAINGKHIDCVRELLEDGADSNLGLSDGRTPLCLAAEAGQTEIILELITRGADPNKHGAAIRPPVVSAAMAHQTAAVRLLIEHGADPNTRLPDETSSTLLEVGITAGDDSLLMTLLARGADVNAGDKDGRSALNCAAFNGNLAVCRVLVAKGADLNVAGKVCPLQTAIQARKLDVANLLLDMGADVNCADSTGATPLMRAAEAGDLTLCKRLLDAGATVNATNRLGATALIFTNDIAITRLLLKRHADPNVRAHDPAVYSNVVSALDIAITDGALDRMAVLCNAVGISPPGATDLIAAIIAGDAPKLRERLDAGSPKEGRDDRGLTALAWASVTGSREAIALLIERHVNMNCRDRANRTPLMLVPNAEVARILVEYGARVNVADRNGFTPFHFAVQSGHKDVVTYLAGVKANRHAITRDGRSAIALTTDPAMLKLVNSLDDAK